MTGIITQTKEGETVHFNTEMLDSHDSNDFQMCIHFTSIHLENNRRLQNFYVARAQK